jgi:hypothetical protein
MRLKKVSLTADVFVISNYRSRIDVPLRDVERVSGSRFMSPELIRLRFRRPTPLDAAYGSGLASVLVSRLPCSARNELSSSQGSV